jgi:homoserine acetyltransferase
MRAIRRHDVAARFGGDLAHAARAVAAPMLVVTSDDDQMVSSGPAVEFARHAGAEVLRVPSACGHALFWCESSAVGAAVRRFVDRDVDGGARRVRAALR